MPSALDAELFRLPEELPALYWLQLWRTGQKNWKTLLLFTACGASLGLLIAAFTTPLYHASTSIEVQAITDNFLKSQDGNPNAGAESELMDLQTQIRIMLSGSVVDHVVSGIAAREGPASLPALRQAAATLNAHVAGPTRIIEISSDSTDPRITSLFVNALAADYIDQHTEARWTGARRGVEKTTIALEEMRGKLEKSEASLQEYATASGLLLSPDRNILGEDKARSLQTEVSQAHSDTVMKQSRFDAVRSSASVDQTAIVNDPTIHDMEAKLTDLRRQLAELETTYTPGYSKVKRVQAQIEPLEAAIAKSLQGAENRARSEYEEARQRENSLASAYRTQMDAVAVQEARKVHYDALRREVDAARSIYDAVLGRSKEATIASSMRSSNVRVLDPARPATQPFQPRRARLALLGSIAGLFLGFGFTSARQQTDHAVRAPGELNRLLHVREFAPFPSGSGPIDVSTFEREPAGVASLSSVRAMRTSLMLDPPQESARVLAVVSAHQGEGKTCITLHLAASLAAVGKRVLLIDGDLAAPRLHLAFKIAGTSGLIDLLGDEVGRTDIGGYICPSGLAGVSLLPAGHAGTRSAELLYSQHLPTLIAYARNNFDIVLVDTPPLLQIPEARMLGRAADAVILVARAGRTDRDALLTVCQRMAEDKTRMTGCVLNDWNSEQAQKPYRTPQPVSRTRALRLANFIPGRTPRPRQKAA